MNTVPCNQITFEDGIVLDAPIESYRLNQPTLSDMIGKGADFTLNTHEKKARRIATLLAGYMRDNLTQDEHDELDLWVGASDKNMRLFEELTEENRIQLALQILNDPQFTKKPSIIQCIKNIINTLFNLNR